MADRIQDRIIAIIATQAILDVSDVHPYSTLTELGIDSLGLVETFFAIEEAFDITIPFNADNPAASLLDISTVASVVAAVERLVAERPE